jgi:hypothetical protein
MTAKREYPGWSATCFRSWCHIASGLAARRPPKCRASQCRCSCFRTCCFHVSIRNDAGVYSPGPGTAFLRSLLFKSFSLSVKSVQSVVIPILVDALLLRQICGISCKILPPPLSSLPSVQNFWLRHCCSGKSAEPLRQAAELR